MGPRVAMALASWPAPLGNRMVLGESEAAAFSTAARTDAVARAPACRRLNFTSTSVSVAFAISAQRCDRDLRAGAP